MGRSGKQNPDATLSSGAKFTGRLFKAAIMKYLAHLEEQKMQKQRGEKGRGRCPAPGRRTVKQLIKAEPGACPIFGSQTPSIKGV